MADHPLLNSLKANKPALGAWLTLPGTFNARVVAQSSPHISWICIDCEHGLIPLVPGAIETVAAIHGSKGNNEGPSAIVRVPATGKSTGTGWQIKNALDAGARGIVVPMVGTAEKAKEIVADSRFPPLGRRGFGSPVGHTNWSMTDKDYLKVANESIVVMVQIETKQAVDNVKEIAGVDGLDVLLIGPYDLSISLGFPTPNPDPHPEVEKVIQTILKTAHDNGKKCAIFCSSGAQSKKRAEQGFDMISVMTDVWAIQRGLATEYDAAAQ